MTTVWRGCDGETAVVGDFGSWAVGLKWHIGKLLDLLGVTVSAEEEEREHEGEAEEKKSDKRYHEIHHKWCHGCGCVWAVPSSENGNDGHGNLMNVWASRAPK